MALPARAACPLGASAVCDGSSCGGETRPTGTIIYNDSVKVHSICLANGSWQAMGTFEAPPAGCDTPGTPCGDGSTYVGITPDGGQYLYVTSAAHEASRQWNAILGNGATADDVDDGDGNTADLVAQVSGSNTFPAAVYCDGLEAHGHDDWYLPAINELLVLLNSGSPFAGMTADSYWSSTSMTYQDARRTYMGAPSTISKTQDYPVRCVRQH